MAAELVLQIVPDRWTAAEKELVGGSSDQSSLPSVRRPTNGIVLREETFATLRVVVNTESRNQWLIDAGSRSKKEGAYVDQNGVRRGDVYSNFLLQQVQEERMEKSQIIETFGEPFIFFYGQRARVISFTGVLLNTEDFNWRDEWWVNYETYLRGTRCVENDARVYLSFDNILVGGYVLAASSSQDVREPGHVSLQFQMFVTSYSPIQPPGDPKVFKGLSRNIERWGSSNLYGLSEDAYKQLLPKPSSGQLTGQATVDKNGMTRLQKADAIALTPIKAAKQAAKTAEVALNAFMINFGTATGLGLHGVGVQVPVGFAGGLEYDDTPLIKKARAGQGYAVTFTTYSDNHDEYVGVGNHYGTFLNSLNKESVLANLGIHSLEQEVKRGQEAIKKAKQQWADKGVFITERQVGPATTFLMQKSFGLTTMVVDKTVMQSPIWRGDFVSTAPTGPENLLTPYHVPFVAREELAPGELGAD